MSLEAVFNVSTKALVNESTKALVNESTKTLVNESTRMLALTGTTGYLVVTFIRISIIVIIASMIAKMITTAISRFGKEAGIRKDILRSINKIITYFIGFMSLVLILQIFKFDIATFVASFGIVGLVLAVGSQSIISNFISGMLIMLEKPFIIGDFIEVTGFQGVVEDIKVRSTSVKTFDGRFITIPNSTLTSNAVVNYSKTGGILVKIPFSFTADVDLGKVSEIMISAAKNTQGVKPYHTEVLVTGMKQSAPSWNIEVELRFWVNEVLDRDIVISNVTGRVKEELAKEKIITFPPLQQDS